MMSDLTVWLARITDGATARAISEKVPYSYSTIARWMRADSIPCEAIVKIATAYHSKVLEALVTGKHITENDAEISAKTQDVVRMAPSRMLSDEVQRRLLVYEDTLRKV